MYMGSAMNVTTAFGTAAPSAFLTVAEILSVDPAVSVFVAAPDAEVTASDTVGWPLAAGDEEELEDDEAGFDSALPPPHPVNTIASENIAAVINSCIFIITSSSSMAMALSYHRLNLLVDDSWRNENQQFLFGFCACIVLEQIAYQW